MQLGMIGLGRMGANMARRLMKADHECVVYDAHPETVEGAIGSASLEAFVASLTQPRAVWLMAAFPRHAQRPAVLIEEV
jgi:6-phosphogluconate dehydrogenase